MAAWSSPVPPTAKSGRIRGMIYLDVFGPHSGQSLWDLIGPEAAERQRLAAKSTMAA